MNNDTMLGLLIGGLVVGTMVLAAKQQELSSTLKYDIKDKLKDTSREVKEVDERVSRRLDDFKRQLEKHTSVVAR